jgi:hypothetical protein
MSIMPIRKSVTLVWQEHHEPMYDFSKLGVSDRIGLRSYPQNLTWLIPAEGSVACGKQPKRRV